MTPHSKRYCINGCNRFVFAYDRCIYCYKKEILYPKQKEKEKKYYKIKPVSDKRKKLNDVYSDKKLEKWKQLCDENKNICFFTSVKISKIGPVPDFHHTLGRDGEMLSNMDYAFPCLFRPHREYHDLKYDYEHLQDVDWYFPWLNRMKIELPIIYFKEMRKIEKANAKVKQVK